MSHPLGSTFGEAIRLGSHVANFELVTKAKHVAVEKDVGESEPGQGSPEPSFVSIFSG